MKKSQRQKINSRAILISALIVNRASIIRLCMHSVRYILYEIHPFQKSERRIEKDFVESMTQE